MVTQVGRIPFNQQIRNFESTLDQITRNLGADHVANAIAHCIFFVGMGSNDYLNNYLMPNYNTRNVYNAQQFAELLVRQYTRQLTVSCFITQPIVSGYIGNHLMVCQPWNLKDNRYRDTSYCSPNFDSINVHQLLKNHVAGSSGP